MSDSFAADDVFDKMAKRLSDNPDLASSVDGIIKFVVNNSGDLSKSWVLDLTSNGPSVSNDEDAQADVTIAVADNDMVDLATGELNPMMAFMQGKVKVTGNMMLAQKLDMLLG